MPFGPSQSDLPIGKHYGYQVHTVHGQDVVRIDPFAQEPVRFFRADCPSALAMCGLDLRPCPPARKGPEIGKKKESIGFGLPRKKEKLAEK